MLIRSIAGILLILLAAQTGWTQSQQDHFARLHEQHKKVLKRWLAKKPELRPASEGDASKEDLEAWRKSNKNFFPYYVVGDFNQDGMEDFAVILKVKNAEDKGAIAVFNAPFSNLQPAYFKREIGVQQYYIEYNEELKSLYVSIYETHGFYLKPKGKKYTEIDPHDESQLK